MDGCESIKMRGGDMDAVSRSARNRMEWFILALAVFPDRRNLSSISATKSQDQVHKFTVVDSTQRGTDSHRACGPLPSAVEYLPHFSDDVTVPSATPRPCLKSHNCSQTR